MSKNTFIYTFSTFIYLSFPFAHEQNTITSCLHNFCTWRDPCYLTRRQWRLINKYTGTHSPHEWSLVLPDPAFSSTASIWTLNLHRFRKQIKSMQTNLHFDVVGQKQRHKRAESTNFDARIIIFIYNYNMYNIAHRLTDHTGNFQYYWYIYLISDHTRLITNRFVGGWEEKSQPFSL